MYAEERHAMIERALSEHGSVSVATLADELAVAAETVRRDLDLLESRGSLRRVHGGAVLSSKTSRVEESVAQRNDRNAGAKARIARAAMRLIPASFSGAVVLDAGTTTGMLAHQISRWQPESQHQSLVVITNSLTIAAAVAGNPDVEVQVLGGRIRGITSAAVGPTTVAHVARLRPDIAFIGANGVHAQFGFSTPDDEEAAVKHAITMGARRTVALVDASKLDEETLTRFAELRDVDTLITDEEPSEVLRDALAEAGVELVIA